MSVEKRYYASTDSARRALRKWGIGAGDCHPYIVDAGSDNAAPIGKVCAVYLGKDGPIKALTWRDGREVALTSYEIAELENPERGTQTMSINVPQKKAAERGAAVHKALETDESTGDANLDALVDTVRNAEPPMHRKQKAKLDKAKRKAERKRRLKAQRKNRKGGK